MIRHIPNVIGMHFVTLKLKVSSKGKSYFLGWTKIGSFDPPLASVCTSYAAEPLPALAHPPANVAGRCPCGNLHLNRRVHQASIGIVVLTWIKARPN
jgi:hypothetical protein